MKQDFLKTFMKLWGYLFKKHPWMEAFCLSVIFHFSLLFALFFCSGIYEAIFPEKLKEKTINIEFIK